MKQIPLFVLILVAAGALATACAAPATPTKESNSAQIEAILTVTAPKAASSSTTAPTAQTAPVNPSSIQLVAHRGGAALAPENTLGAFSNAIRLGGVDMVETDVHLSKDGEMVIMHDPNVATTTDGSGQISDLTLADIKKLNAAAKFSDAKWSPQQVPTLGEVLDTVKGKVGIQIEIKLTAGNRLYPGIERKVADAVNARGMADQVIIISFDFPTLKEVKSIDPRLKTGALAQANYLSSRGNNPDKIVDDVIAATGADYFMPTSATASDALVRAAHARGIKLAVWTVNTPEEMRRMVGYGVDGITSDKPDELKKVLGR